ncbi:hypothetical protein [Amycolatopsis alkalitolerans]|uniref:Bacterial bifunctional deaminase-reductase C-terminal domain-containing protein n=1 Tax=Amycolatopsis alkalitolerans TaxID=2547244 RepID=A0A5C4M006_9PSEU|nr:hypothetical protein [Amycolatopsis alkalitolerans]TNC23941.1 hypothetical protein FG385_19790 [Amycolatopsis alkalitolerans]
MATTIMGAAAVSLDGFMADTGDGVGPLFDYLVGGEVEWSLPGGEHQPSRSSRATADFMRTKYADIAAVVMGRRVFDLTNGWNGVPAAGEHVFVVTHKPPADWEFAGTAPFTSSAGWKRASRRRGSTRETGSSTCPRGRSAARPCGWA